MSDAHAIPSVPSTALRGQEVFALEYAAQADRIARWIVDTLANRLHRRGLVIAISGGIDSSVCAALAVRAVGATFEVYERGTREKQEGRNDEH